MRRTLLSAVVAASLALPSVALAVQARGGQIAATNPRGLQLTSTQSPLLSNHQGSGTLGAGQIDANTPGHVTGPGKTRVDNDVLAPVNDIQVGRGTEDTLQSKNPKPIY
jgi:hypothetical protein